MGEEKEIRAVLERYQDALNSSSTSEVLKLYTKTGVFMSQHSPSAVGEDAVRKAYDACFEAITLKVKFDIVEVRSLPRPTS